MSSQDDSTSVVREKFTGWWAKLHQQAFAPIDIASLVSFRIAFGLLMLIEVYRFLAHDWIERYFIRPEFYFTYFGFDWVQPWLGPGMYIHFLALGLLSLFVAIGFVYRLSAFLLGLGFTYVFLLDKANYLNHLYLICLVCFLLALVPAHRSASFDARLRPKLRSQYTPAWAVWSLRFQFGIVYFYGGIAKLNWDWLNGQPMLQWLPERQDVPFIGWTFAYPSVAYLFSYAGLVFDLCIVPLLLWRRTRMLAFIAVLCFHLLNARLWSIGIFPWLAIAATFIFFDPDWPRRIFNWPQQDERPCLPMPRLREHFVLAALLVYLAVQLLVPLRSWLYPGNVSWTEEGHRFSWHMKLRDKSGRTRFIVSNPQSNRSRVVNPAEHLTRRQRRKMKQRPDMILQFAHYLARLESEASAEPVEVRAKALISLNGRSKQDLIDPMVDLAAQPRTLSSVLSTADWILPLTTPLTAADN